MDGTLVECCIRRWDLRRCVWLSDISLNPFVLKQSSNAIRFRTFQQLIVILLSTTPCSVTGQAPANHDITDGIYEKLVVFNSETGVLVRELPALLEDTIKTFEVTRDGRLVVYSTKKSPHLFVYDIVSSSLIDWIAFESPVSSIAFDPSNAFMYVGLEHLSGGLLVLGNHHVFELSQSSAVLKPTPKEPIYITQHVDSTTVSNKNNKNVDKPDKEDQDDLFFTSTASLEKYRLTLSGMSHQRLEAIVHLDAIKQRNAGTENVQKNMVSDLPFFLPTMYEGKELKFVSSTPKETLASEHNKKLKGSSSNLLKDTKSELQQLLLAMHHNNTESKRRAITSYFSTLSPSGIDLTLLQLGSLAGSTDAELVWMLDYFIDCIYSREQADLIQALLAVFLNKHSLSILDILQGQNNTDICDSDTSAQRETLTQQLKGRLERMRELIKQDWEPLELQCHQATTFLKFLTHTQIE